MNWRECLDARIDRCPGCDDYRWDGLCRKCTKTPITMQSTTSVFAAENPFPDPVLVREEAA